MRKSLLTAILVTSLPFGSAVADTLRDILSSGATTASTYMTFKDEKLVVGAQEDASLFVASDGAIRGAYLEAALKQMRAEHPHLEHSDMALAKAILAAE
ncbi:DUF2388 domain-containing protein [Stutzerimonas urumqiensis]|uniref:DUF2388 domain-containing protein n=1 Tax=Stutzerimonas urumqiensis TaxID=638269 RepID=UPI000EB579BD|nr:DUF2388 domain-containing protein [Stutzerimonas urumqiensis]